MKTFYILTFMSVMTFMCACGSQSKMASTKAVETPQQEVAKAAMTDNAELQEIYDEDQGDRKVAEIDWSVVSVRDSLRQVRVYEMLEEGLVQTAQDYKNAAMVFQHGRDIAASEMAVSLMRKAIELNPEMNKWLLAAAIDRDLMRKGEPQIYGTQYRREHGGPWELYEIDPSKVTDEERREYNVETLAEQQEKVKKMNKKKLSEFLKEGKSIDEVVAFCQSEDLKESEYDLSEYAINNLGYELLEENKEADALKIFEMNTQLYPDAFNTHDSLGECLVKMGKVKEGIAAYKKSLELNPKNDNATKVLAELGEQ